MKRMCVIKYLAVSASLLSLMACDVSELIDATPVAQADSVTTVQDTATTIDVQANDTGLSDTPLSMTVSTNASNGSTNIVGNTISYTPNPGFFGEDSFEYTLTDNDDDSASAIVTVTVIAAANATPVTMNDSATTPQDPLVSINVQANDTGLSDTPLSMTVSTNASNGSTNIVGNAIQYTPNAGFFGEDSFEYTLTDKDGDSDNATVTVTVTEAASNVTPVANDDVVSTPQDTLASINVQANDTGLSDTPLSMTVSTNASNGSTSIVGNAIHYTPNAGFFGEDSFEYTLTDKDGDSDNATVTVTVTEAASNATPVANDDVVSTPQDTLVSINVLSNDTGLSDTPLSMTVSTNASNGSTNIVGNAIHYTPNTGFFGEDSFEYTLTDKDGDSDTATVTVTVTASGTSAISALTVFDTTNAADWAIKSNLQTGDTMHGDRSFLIEQIPQDLIGQEWLSTANDSKSFNDNLAQFTVTSNAEVWVLHGDAISNKPDWLNAWTETDLNLTNDEPKTYSAYRRTFTADSLVILGKNGGTGQGMYIVVVSDEALSMPVANADSASTSQLNAININVTGNDEGLSGATYTLMVSENASNGSTSIIDSDNIQYTPDATFSGIDSFEYTVTDVNSGEFSTATVEVTVTQTGAALPVANDDTATTAQNTSATLNVTSNDSGLEDTPYALSVTDDATDGTTQVIDSDTIEYTPNAGFAGMDSFTYTLTDNNGDSDTAIVSIKVNAIPVANVDNAVTLKNTEITIDVLANDSGLNDAPLTLSAGSPTDGSSEVLGLEIRYTPNSNFVGEDGFNYTITDKDGESAIANVSVMVDCEDCALNTDVTLYWNAKLAADVVSSYEVYFAKSTTEINATDATELLQTLSVSAPGFDPSNPAVTFDAWEDLKLNQGDNLCFRLKARNAAGASDFSTGICGQIPEAN